MNWISFDEQQPRDGQWCYVFRRSEKMGFSRAYLTKFRPGEIDDLVYWLPHPQPECPLDRQNWPVLGDNGSKRPDTATNYDNATQGD